MLCGLCALCVLSSGCSCVDSDADRTRDAGAAEAAVAVGILREILLVVLLRVVELRRGQNLRRDRTVAHSGEPLLIRITRSLRRAFLILVVVVDAGAVLRADVVALPHALRWIVMLPEQLQQ